MTILFIPLVLALHSILGPESGPENYGQFGFVLFTLGLYAGLQGLFTSALLIESRCRLPIYLVMFFTSTAIFGTGEMGKFIVADNLACLLSFAIVALTILATNLSVAKFTRAAFLGPNTP